MKFFSIRNTVLPALLLSLIFVAASCKKDKATTTPTAKTPTITTNGLIINLTSTTAQSGGTISDPGTSTVTETGVVYSTTNKTPTTSDTKVVGVLVSSSSAFPLDFSSDLTGLTPNTTYYLRAYATNSSGTAYGSVVTFATVSGSNGFTTAVTTFTGSGTQGFADGISTAATFNNPQGVSVDASGNIYIADSYNHSIRMATADGTVKTIAGDGTIGYTEGNALTARFYGPNGVVADAQGNLYVADLGNNVIRKITAAGVVSTFAGGGSAGYANATGTSALFNNPSSLAIDGTGNIFVADFGNHVIRKITPAGVVTTLAGVHSPGFLNGTGSAAQFRNPHGIAIDAAGNLFVADQGNNAIRKVTPDGVVTTVAGGPSQPDLLNFPAGIALDKAGNIFVADEGGRILECTTSNVLLILAGGANLTGFVNGDGTTARFNNPQAIAVDANNNIYVADQNNNVIRKLVVTQK